MSRTDRVKSNQKEEMESLEILIIDDNEQITKMLTTFLELKEHKCTVANDGKEGLAIIKENRQSKKQSKRRDEEFGNTDN